MFIEDLRLSGHLRRTKLGETVGVHLPTRAKLRRTAEGWDWRENMSAGVAAEQLRQHVTGRKIALIRACVRVRRLPRGYPLHVTIKTRLQTKVCVIDSEADFHFTPTALGLSRTASASSSSSARAP